LKLIDVDSVIMSKVGYDNKSMTLRIMFGTLNVYDYYKVEPFIYENMLKSDSIGTYFHKYIKDKYNFHKHKNRGRVRNKLREYIIVYRNQD
jgi:hypothetical protein